MQTGICKMCLQQKQIVGSHFVPRALYDYCRSTDYDPIRVGADFAMITGRQIKDHLLCTECERILNESGENWIVRKFATIERRTFPLYEIVTRGTPIFVDGDLSVYYGKNIPELEIGKITHFAAGLFWKASIHSWSKNITEPRIDLGPYSDRLRMYLLGKAPFPDYMKLWVNITPPSEANISFVEPYEGKSEDGFKTYFCYMPGLMFSLNVGKMVTQEIATSCFATSPDHPIYVSEAIHDNFESIMKQKYFKVRKSRNIIEMRERRAAQEQSSR